MTFELEDLYAILRDVLALRRFEFRPEMSAQDVPGWDSLNHTVLLMEIESRTGIELSASETVDLPNIAALRSLILERLATVH